MTQLLHTLSLTGHNHARNPGPGGVTLSKDLKLHVSKLLSAIRMCFTSRFDYQINTIPEIRSMNLDGGWRTYSL